MWIMDYDYRQRLANAIHSSGALKIKTDGTLFKLKSGEQSNWLVNLKETVLTPEYAALIADGLLYALQDFPNITHVGGVAMGGIPLVANAVMLSNGSTRPLNGFYVRPEAKDHGTGNLIDGHNPTGKHVGMFEDVTTTGGSLLKTVDHLQNAGATVDVVVAVLNRGDDVAAQFEQRGITYRALITKADLGLA